MSVLKFVTSVPAYIINFFRRKKFDNFLAGVIFGAIFSLVVNILTVHIQETVTKQRVFEAVEREIASHLLVSSSVFSELESFKESGTGKQLDYYPNSFFKRLDLDTWSSGETLKYIFELDPQVSSGLSNYYNFSVKPVNSLLDSYQKDFDDFYDKKCSLVNALNNSDFFVDKDACYQVTVAFLQIFDDAFSDNDKRIDSLLKTYHPTQDRLDSVYLRILLGNKSVELLKKPNTNQ